MSINKNILGSVNIFGICLMLFIQAGISHSGLSQSQQNITFKTITQSDGLSSDIVTSIYKDSFGFIWVGTLSGLNRYNGESFTVFKKPINGINSLSDNQITVIAEDADQQLWIGTKRGLNLYDYQKNRFTPFVNDSEDKASLSDNWIKDLYLDDQGNFWILTQNGLNRLIKTETGYEFEHFFLNGEHNSFLDISQDKDNNLWLGTWQAGLVRLNPVNGEYVQFLSDDKLINNMLNNKVEHITTLENGLILLGFAEFGLYFFDPAVGKVIDRDKLPEHKELYTIDPPIYSFAQGKKGLLWIGTAEGIFAYDIFKQKMVYDGRTNQFINQYSERRDQARTVYVDDENIVWAGIGKTGLNKYAPGKDKFARWVTSLKSPKIYRDFLTSVVELPNGDLWAGTTDGLIKINPDGKVERRFFLGSKKEIKFVRDLKLDSTGKLWVATEEGLWMFNPETYRAEWHLDLRGGLLDNSISQISRFDTSQLWIINEKGIQLLDIPSKKLLPHPIVKKFASPLVSKIYKDNDGDYWISADEKLSFFDSEKQSFSDINEIAKTPSILSNFSVNDIFHDSYGFLWFATNYGLNRYNKATGEFTYYFQGDGLPGDIIRHITEDKNGDLWILSSQGLSRFNYETGVFINFNKNDGLAPSVHALITTKAGNIMLLGEKLFVHFSPDAIRINNNAPPVYITALAVNGVDHQQLSYPFSENSLILSKALQFNYKHEIIKIRVSALNYLSPEKNRYAYRLSDTGEWIDMGDNNELTLTKLSPGDYQLHIKGSNDDQVWNEEGLSIQLSIKPAWYLSTWAYFVYFALFISVLAVTYQYIIYKERLKIKFEKQRSQAEKKYEIEKIHFQKTHELDQIKIKFFHDLSHEFKTPLTLIVGPVDKLLEKCEEDSTDKKLLILVRDNVKRLEELIEQLLDFRKLEIGSSENGQSNQQLKIFLKGLEYSFFELAHSRNVKLHVENTIPDYAFYYDRDKLYKILSNLLSNAIKFTPSGRHVMLAIKILDPDDAEAERLIFGKNMYQITVANTKDVISEYFLHVTVEDEGVGIPDNEIFKIFNRYYQVKSQNSLMRGNGIGLSLTKELVEILQGEIYLKSSSEGSRFDVLLPLVPIHGNNVDQVKLTKKVSPTDLSKEKTHSPTSKKKPLILVAEDNEDILKFLETVLLPHYDVKKASSGREAIEKTTKYLPDLIITDIMMPGIDGYGLCKKLKENNKLADIPVIVLTAKDNDATRKSFLALGVDDYLTKPFDIDLLNTKVSQLIDSRKKLRNKYAKNINVVSDLNLINREDEFLQRAAALVEKHIADPDFNKSTFASEMGISNSQLYKKLVTYTGQSANEFVRNIRLNKAAFILRKGTNLQVSEVGYMVGFSDPNYFTRKFKQYFGITPRQYAQKYQSESKL